MAKRPNADAPEIVVESRAALRAWLSEHHAQKSGVWLVSYKKAAGDRYLPYGDIVRECLCFGWVDSLPRSKDDLRSMLWISPRKAGSNWSRVNKEIVAELDAAGLLTTAGRAVIDRARADGTWTALDAVEAGEVPDDLDRALGPALRPVWDGWPRSVRRAALEILLNAKRAETRERKIGEIVAAATAGERPFQWKRR